MPRKHSDGGGLHLLVSPQGSKLWRLACRCDGKQKTLALGAYPIVRWRMLARSGMAKLLASGIDPSQQAKTDKINRLASSANTFGSVADEFLAKIEHEGKAAATLAKKRVASWHRSRRSR